MKINGYIIENCFTIRIYMCINMCVCMYVSQRCDLPSEILFYQKLVAIWSLQQNRLRGELHALAVVSPWKKLFSFSIPRFMSHMVKWGNAFQSLTQCLVHSFSSINFVDRVIDRGSIPIATPPLSPIAFAHHSSSSFLGQPRLFVNEVWDSHTVGKYSTLQVPGALLVLPANIFHFRIIISGQILCWMNN